MLDYIPEIIRAGVSCIRIEAMADGGIDGARLEEITRLYRNAVDGRFRGGGKVQKRCRDITDGYTTGHYKRGVL